MWPPKALNLWAKESGNFCRILVVAVCNFTKFWILQPLSFELKTMSWIPPPPPWRGRESDPSLCTPRHIPLVSLGSYPRGKPMTCAQGANSNADGNFLRKFRVRESLWLFRGVFFNSFVFRLTAATNNAFELRRNVSFCCLLKYEIFPYEGSIAERLGFNIISYSVLSTILRKVSRLERIRVLKQNVEAVWPSG